MAAAALAVAGGVAVAGVRRADPASTPLLVARLPFQGEGADAIGAFLVAGFFNLLAVALLAPALRAGCCAAAGATCRS